MNFWEATYKQNISKMIGVCRRYTQNRQVAEDLAHDAFLIAIDKFSSFENKGPFEAWLRRIVVNVALQHLREQNKQKIVEENASFLEIQDENPNEENIIFTETELLNFISLLPEHHRLVFNLYVIDNFTHAQIGIKLGISEGTSKSHLSRARKKLKELMFNDLEQNKSKKRAFLWVFLPSKLWNTDTIFRKQLRNWCVEPQNKLSLDSVKFQGTAIPQTYFSTSLVATIGLVSLAGFIALFFGSLSEEKRDIKPNVFVESKAENSIKIDSIKFVTQKKITESTATISDNAINTDENIKTFEEMKSINTLSTLLLASSVLAFDSASLSEKLRKAFVNQEQTIATTKPISDDKSDEIQGTCYASKLLWSAEDNKIYLSGPLVKVNFDSNKFGGVGKFSFMGKVGYLVVDGSPIPLGKTIKLSNKNYKIVKLSAQDAIRKYGENGKSIVLEITKEV